MRGRKGGRGYKGYADADIVQNIRDDSGGKTGKIEEGGKIPQNQTGFRKKMGTMNNIYVLNYMVNMQEKGQINSVFYGFEGGIRHGR